MPDFNIDVTRTGFGFASIPVKDAKDVVEAEERALDDAGNFSFSDKGSQYSLTHGSSAPDEFEGLPNRLLVIGVITSSEFSPLPSWAELTVGPALLRKLGRLAATCKELKAESLRVFASDLNEHPEWAPDSQAYRLGLPRFEISDTAFWLSIPDEVMDRDVQTVEIDLKTLLIMMKEQPEGPLFFAGYPDMLKAEYEEHALAATVDGIEVQHASPAD